MTALRNLCPSLISLLLATPPIVAGAASLELLPPADGDLIATRLTRSVPISAINPPADEPIHVAWALSPAAAPDARPSPPVSESRGYWLRVTAAELEQGVAIDTTAPGAVVRVNPLDQVDVVLDPETFILVDDDRNTLSSGRAMELLVSADQLAASDSPFPSGTAAFRLHTEIGDGRFVLRTPALNVEGSSRFVVHVFEPASSAIARLTGRCPAYLAGNPIEVEAALTVDGRAVAANSAEAFLIAPGGRRTPVKMVKRDGALVARARVRSALSDARLWEIEVRLGAELGDHKVQRTVRTAFAVAAPTARLDGRVERVDGKGLTIRFGLETAAEGRYELRGILWGTTNDGGMAPVAVADSAANLGSGRGELDLVFGRDLLAGSVTRAPYELRDLQLVDQGRMGVLHRQAQAVRID